MLAELERAFAAELFAGGARLALYRDNVLSGLADALAALYPACAALVGAEFFGALTRRFAREVPSRSPDLCDYGAELGDFLERFEPVRALRYLPDVARLEWALHRARHSPVSEPLETARLAALFAERSGALRLRLAPGTALLASPWPIDRIHAAAQPGAEGTVSLDEGAVALVVAREPTGARLARVAAAELAVLAACARGETLEEAAGAWPGSAEALGRFLAHAAERRWLGGAA
jgi:putative DNA-binding protein